jgi:hypothetical protein
MSVPPVKYFEGRNAELELIQALEDPKVFNTAFKGGKKQCLQTNRLLIQEHSLNFNTDGTGVAPADVIRWFHGDLCLALEDNFNISTDHAEMCWKVAMVWFRVGIFNTWHYFKDGPTDAILMMARYCPGVLWRIITAQNVPDCPLWAEMAGERAQKEFRQVMDEAATVDEKTDVTRIKAKLVEFFDEQEDLDYPDAGICEWLGMDSE